MSKARNGVARVTRSQRKEKPLDAYVSKEEFMTMLMDEIDRQMPMYNGTKVAETHDE